jgi:hypothetical protein
MKEVPIVVANLSLAGSAAAVDPTPVRQALWLEGLPPAQPVA